MIPSRSPSRTTPPGKTRITIYMDDAVLKRFKAQSEKSGKGYQTLINEALNSYLGLTSNQ